jgi:hypothetical protein
MHGVGRGRGVPIVVQLRGALALHHCKLQGGRAQNTAVDPWALGCSNPTFRWLSNPQEEAAISGKDWLLTQLSLGKHVCDAKEGESWDHATPHSCCMCWILKII